MTSFILYTKAKDSGKFNCRPAMAHTLQGKDIYCNEEPVLPCDKHPHNMRLFVITHQFGAVCAVWASSDQDALDAACNLNALDAFLASDDDIKDNVTEESDGELTRLGNAGELFVMADAWLYEVEWDVARDWDVLKAFARCDDNDTLDYV
jgi:hypothetical protein